MRGSLDGEAVGIKAEEGFWYVSLPSGEHRIEYELELKPKRWYASSHVSEDIHRCAVGRGPFVYCLEETDNGKELHCLSLPKEEELRYEFREALFGGTGVIRAQGVRVSSEGSALYTDDPGTFKYKPQELTFIPYYTWANRGENEMRVWISEV